VSAGFTGEAHWWRSVLCICCMSFNLDLLIPLISTNRKTEIPRPSQDSTSPPPHKSTPLAFKLLRDPIASLSSVLLSQLQQKRTKQDNMATIAPLLKKRVPSPLPATATPSLATPTSTAGPAAAAPVAKKAKHPSNYSATTQRGASSSSAVTSARPRTTTGNGKSLSVLRNGALVQRHRDYNNIVQLPTLRAYALQSPRQRSWAT